jgi:hypothetical protein
MSPMQDLDPLAWLAEPLEPTNYEDARVLLARPELVVPVLGAGVSVGAGQPTSAKLAEQMLCWDEAGQLRDDGFGTNDARVAANALLTKGLLDEDTIRTRVVDYLRSQAGEPTRLIDHLTGTPSRLIVTLNYDLSVEEAAERLGREAVSLILRRDQGSVLFAVSSRATRERLVVVHLHGSIDAPLDIILHSLAYSELGGLDAFRKTLTLLLNNFTLVFMGTRLDEQLIANELLLNRIGQAPHLFVNNRETCEELLRGRMSINEGGHLVVIRAYPDEDGTHSALTDLAEYLVRPPIEETVPSEPLAPAGEEVAHFIAPTLVPVAGGNEDTYMAFLIAAGERSAVDESSLRAVGTRAVLIGPPGSGKTTLMRQLGAGQDEDVHPLLVRLADVSYVGDPTRLLEKWARNAEGLRGEEEVSPEALRSRVFHFFLDGLDEVGREVQEKLADKIVQLARLHPTHLFTVATRPTPAADRFMRPEWQHVALSPDGEWQRAYLAERGLTWEELRDHLPLLDDLRELLQLPFFLDAVVRLHAAGELTGARDLLDLVSRLITLALSAEDLPIEEEAAREWLCDIALTMQLSERTELTVGELSDVPISAGLQAAGSSADIADVLVQAKIFAPRADGGYSFIHRIVGEALVAEALLARGPIAELVDVIMPSVEEVTGVRADWLVPTTLAGVRSEDWRAAIHDHDPLAAARSVPDDAPLEERLEAARLIWDTYCERHIWIWDYRTPSLVEDADVLARLLRTEGLADLREQLLVAARESEGEIRGNAFRVLSLLGVAQIADSLRAVLDDDGAEPVMRRVAARAAVTLKLDELHELIVQRALTATDDPEAQDMTFYALDLASAAEFPELAVRLGGARAGYLIAGRVERELSPRDQLRYMAASASNGERELSSSKEQVLRIVEMLDPAPDAAYDLGFIAAAWRLAQEPVRNYLVQFPQEATAGLVAAARSAAAYDYELLDFLDWFSTDYWRQADAPELVVQWKEREQQP